MLKGKAILPALGGLSMLSIHCVPALGWGQEMAEEGSPPLHTRMCVRKLTSLHFFF